MSITYVNSAANDASKALTLNGVTAGNLIVCLLLFQDAPHSPTPGTEVYVTESGGSGGASTWSYSDIVNYSNQALSIIAYTLSSVKSGNVTYTWTETHGAGHCVGIMEYHASSAWELTHINAGAGGAGPGGGGGETTATSGNENSSIARVAFGVSGYWSKNHYHRATIHGDTVDHYVVPVDSSYLNSGCLTSKILTDSDTGNYNSVITMGDWVDYGWVADLIAFNEASGGPSSYQRAITGAMAAAVGTVTRKGSFKREPLGTI